MRTLLRILTRLLAPVLLAASASAHSVLVVDHAAGPGSTHTTITAAIAAAQDGDFVLVRDGFYAEDVVLDGKGLRIHADAGATVRVYDLRVVNLGPGQTAAIGGLTVTGLSTGPDLSVQLVNNQGPVWLQFGSESTLGPQVMLVEDCASVVLQGCSFGTDLVSLRCSLSECFEAAVTIERSEVALFDCDLGGLTGIECDDGHDAGSIGLLAIDADVWIHASRIVGGRGAGDCGGAFFPGRGGVGLELRGTSEVDRLDSEIVGGPGGKGFSVTGVPGAPTNVVSGILQAHGNVGRLVTTEPVLRSLAPTTLDYEGKPNDVVFLLIASDPNPFATLPNVLGPVVVPPTSIVTRLGRADAAGQLSLGLAAPQVANGARTFFLQVSALNHAAGEIVMGEPIQLHVLAAGL